MPRQGRELAARGPLMPAGAVQPLCIGRHGQLKNGLGDGTKKITPTVPGRKFGDAHIYLPRSLLYTAGIKSDDKGRQT